MNKKAVTERFAVVPARIVWLSGGKEMDGGNTTIKVATLLVTLPAKLLRTIE